MSPIIPWRELKERSMFFADKCTYMTYLLNSLDPGVLQINSSLVVMFLYVPFFLSSVFKSDTPEVSGSLLALGMQGKSCCSPKVSEPSRKKHMWTKKLQYGVACARVGEHTEHTWAEGKRSHLSAQDDVGSVTEPPWICCLNQPSSQNSFVTFCFIFHSAALRNFQNIILLCFKCCLWFLSPNMGIRNSEKCNNFHQI